MKKIVVLFLVIVSLVTMGCSSDGGDSSGRMPTETEFAMMDIMQEAQGELESDLETDVASLSIGGMSRAVGPSTTNTISGLSGSLTYSGDMYYDETSMVLSFSGEIDYNDYEFDYDYDDDSTDERCTISGYEDYSFSMDLDADEGGYSFTANGDVLIDIDGTSTSYSYNITYVISMVNVNTLRYELNGTMNGEKVYFTFDYDISI